MRNPLAITTPQRLAAPRIIFIPCTRTNHILFLVARLKQMPQLERLVLHRAIPTDLVVLSEGLKLTVDLPSLPHLSISASVSECAVVLAHLVLPALTRLCVNAEIDLSVYGSVNDLIQCVAQNAHGPQDTEALQSLFIGDDKRRADFVAWTMSR
jgi:hypothetical protein